MVQAGGPGEGSTGRRRHHGGLGTGQALAGAHGPDRAQDRGGVPPGGLAGDETLLVVLVEGVTLGAERLVGDVQTEEDGGVLGAPLPADQPRTLVTDVGADPEVVDADAVVWVLVRVRGEKTVQVRLAVDVVLVEHHVFEDEAVVVELADRFRTLTECFQPLDCEIVVHEDFSLSLFGPSQGGAELKLRSISSPGGDQFVEAFDRFVPAIGRCLFCACSASSHESQDHKLTPVKSPGAGA